MNSPLQTQFMQVALPIMVTLVATMWISSWSQNKRFDDLRDYINHRFDEVSRSLDAVAARLERIELKLDSHDERLVRLEERTSPVSRRTS